MPRCSIARQWTASPFRAMQCAAARKYRVQATQVAGDPALTLTLKNFCIEVKTGAVLPAECDAVVPSDRSRRAGVKWSWRRASNWSRGRTSIAAASSGSSFRDDCQHCPVAIRNTRNTCGHAVGFPILVKPAAQITAQRHTPVASSCETRQPKIESECATWMSLDGSAIATALSDLN